LAKKRKTFILLVSEGDEPGEAVGLGAGMETRLLPSSSPSLWLSLRVGGRGWSQPGAATGLLAMGLQLEQSVANCYACDGGS